MKRLALLFLLPLVGCVSTQSESYEKLRVGKWVEAKGRMVDGKPIVDEVDELKRSESDKADKFELTAQTQSASPESLEVLGLTLKPDAETEYEGMEKESIAKFVPSNGEWVRLKLRSKDDQIRLRTLRKSEPRDQFKVEGEITALDPATSSLSVGAIKMPVAQAASVTMLGERNADDPLALFQADDQKAVPFSVVVNDNLRLGGGGTFASDAQDEYDLNRANTRDRTSTSFSGKLDALWLFDDKASYAMVEIDAARGDTYRRGSPDSTTETFQLTRAVTSIALDDNLQFLVGRQDFDEEREWLYDEVLDGGRFVWILDHWQFDVGGAIGRETLASPNNTEDMGLLTAMVRYRIDADWTLGAYVLDVTDNTVFDHEPMLFGLRSIDEPRYGLGHWAELSFARGHSRFMLNNGGPINDSVGTDVEDIEGWAFDLGAQYTFEGDLRPSFVLGYAYGSGKRDSAADQGYRQTSFNDNNGKLGGVTSVRYYGELLRPELANLAILTCGATIRPFRNGSLSLIYHTYTQDFAAQSGPFNDLRIGTGSIPNGIDPDLGSEIDIIFGFRAASRVTVELAGSRFEPGAGFDGQDAAHKLDFTARFSF